MAIQLVTGTYKALATQLAARIHQHRTSTFDAWLAQPVSVLVPSRSAATGIAAALLEHFPDGVSGVVMTTPEQLAQSLLNAAGEYPRVASDAERRLAMRAAVQGVGDPAFERRGAAVMAERTYRDIRDSGMTTASFAAQLRESRTGNPARLAALCEAFETYDAHIAKLGAIDPADLLRRAADLVRRASIAPLTIFGFYDVTRIQEEFIRALFTAGAITSVYAPVETGSDSLPVDDCRFGSRFFDLVRGLTGSEPQPLATAPAPAITVRASFTPELELLEACRGIRDALDDGVPAGEIAIVTRAVDPAEHRELARCARLFGFRIAEPGRRLALQRIARGVLLLFRLRRDGYRRSDVIEILHSGIDRATVNLTDTPEWLDAGTRKGDIPGGSAATIRQALPRLRLQPWQNLEGPVEAFATVVEALERITREFEQPRGAEAWAAALKRATSLFRIETQDDLAAVRAIDGIAATLRSAAKISAAIDAETVATMIEEAPELPSPPEDERFPTIWFGDVMRLRGRSFRIVHAVRLQHDRFPQRRVDDPFLPDIDRRLLNVREIGDGRDEERMLFHIMVTSARESVECSYATSDGTDAVLRPGQLLKDALITRDPASRSAIIGRFDEWREANPPAGRRSRTQAERTAERILAGEGSLTRGLARRLRALQAFGTASEWDGYLPVDDRLAAKLEEKLARLSPSNFEYFGECPQRFLFSRILGISDLSEPEEAVQIEIRQKGSLDHEILENFYKEVFAGRTDVPPWTPALAKSLEETIDQAFDAFDTTHPPLNPQLRRMERAMTKTKLAAFVTADFDALRAAGLVPAHFEYQFGDPEGGRIPIDVGGVTLPMLGYIDRIDVGSGGKHRIVDYKSGKAWKQKDLAKKIDAGQSLQLALYAIVIAQLFKLEDSKVSGRILPLDLPASRDRDFEFNLGDKRGQLDAILPLFMKAMRDGIYPAFVDDWCKYCPLAPHCRTKYSPEEQQNAAQYAHARAMLEARGGSHE
ncbi:MAG: PD-(D/E)XK nuclease family protein [Thermoanaerobaculia bacterium]